MSECVTNTTNFELAFSAACTECVCTGQTNIDAIEACNADANCWTFLGCYYDQCGGASMGWWNGTQLDMTCAMDNCTNSIGGQTTAEAAGALLTGATCGSLCEHL